MADSQKWTRFFINYGWMFLVILLAVFVVFYLKFSLQTCDTLPGSDISCNRVVFDVVEDTIGLTLNNRLTEDLQINSINFTPPDCASLEGVKLSPNKPAEVFLKCNKNLEHSQKISGNFEISYTLESSGTKTLAGSLKGRVK